LQELTQKGSICAKRRRVNEQRQLSSNLKKIFNASRAVELSQETAEDLKYLQGKCTVLDTEKHGFLARWKQPMEGREEIF